MKRNPVAHSSPLLKQVAKMSYGGVGLRSVRGSGTNGYVQKSRAFVRPGRGARDRNQRPDFDRPPPKQRKPNAKILEHQRKRAIEVKLMDMRDAMEDRGLDEATIESRIQQSRERLLAQKPAAAAARGGSGGRGSHERAHSKQRENTQMRSAFRIQSDFVPGEAFNQERQEQKK